MSSSKLDNILLGPTCFRVVHQTRPAKQKQQRELNTLESNQRQRPLQVEMLPFDFCFCGDLSPLRGKQ